MQNYKIEALNTKGNETSLKQTKSNSWIYSVYSGDCQKLSSSITFPNGFAFCEKDLIHIECVIIYEPVIDVFNCKDVSGNKTETLCIPQKFKDNEEEIIILAGGEKQ